MTGYPTGPDERPADRLDDTEEDLMSTDQTTDRSTGSTTVGSDLDPDPAPGTGVREDGGSPATWASPDPQAAPVARGPALGTLLWGFVVLAVAGLVGAWELADVRVDLSLVLPVGMVAVGALLVLGALVTALRGRS